MKRSTLYIVVATALFVCLTLAILRARPTMPIAILPLGRPHPEIPLEEFQVTNKSSKEFMVRFATMVKASGTWDWERPGGCVVTSYGLSPHSSHEEHALVPRYGECWRLVAFCSPPATSFSPPNPASRVVGDLCKLLGIRPRWSEPFQVMGPEMDSSDAAELYAKLERERETRLPDEPSAIRSAAENGDANAQFGLAGRYFTGTGFEKSLPEAIRWFEAAATNGHAEAAYNLGTIYEYGLSTASNRTQAINWYRRAGERGHIAAQEKLRALAKSDSPESGK